MIILKTNALTNDQKDAVFHLWNSEYPVQLQYSSLKELQDYFYTCTAPTHFFAQDAEEKILGWAFTFTRDGERWFAIIVAGAAQKTGVGTALLREIRKEEQELNGWVTDHNRYIKHNNEAYSSPLPFYLKNDFVLCPGIRLETEKLSAVKIKCQQTRC